MLKLKTKNFLSKRGTHVLKALSLGAKACSGGRMYLYALAAGGQKGVLMDEIQAEESGVAEGEEEEIDIDSEEVFDIEGDDDVDATLDIEANSSEEVEDAVVRIEDKLDTLLDEFEAIRLIDIEGLNQIEAAADMQISRATVQRLLLSGRKKIAEALLRNCALEIQNDIRNIKLKGENKMNIEGMDVKTIAFPTSDKVTIDAHFGQTKEFAIYEVQNNDIVHVKYVTPPPHEPGVLPRYLGELGIDVIVTGGMGRMAVNLFNRQGIDVILVPFIKLVKLSTSANPVYPPTPLKDALPGIAVKFVQT